MELKVSAEKPGYSSSDGTSEPEDQEISEGEDEDDDRNHKHRKREGRSQSMEGNSLDQDFQRPYQKRNRVFQNEYSYRDSEGQDYFTSERDFGSRVEKRRSNMGPFHSAYSDMGQRIRGKQPLNSKLGNGSRGMEPFAWGVYDPRRGLADVSSRSVPPALFAGRNMPNVTTGTSWTSYGLIPGVPTGGLETLHPLSLQGALGPAFNAQMNLGIPRQRCRDFEERGFCLRGDMCPMEHGINRIVVDDFQSLSQFNLPVSVPGPQPIGASPGQGALPPSGTPLGSSLNSKTFSAKLEKPGVSSYGPSSNSGVIGASDVYDPDQPQLTNDNIETSAALIGLNKSSADGTGSFTDADVSSQKITESSYSDFNHELLVRNTTAAGSQSSSPWGRIHISKSSLEVIEKTDSAGKSPGIPDIMQHGLLGNIDGNVLGSSHKLHNDSVHIRKPSQKALCTLFVNGIPLKDNKREALLLHFQKFGDVIDIYIPMSSERAFVQFSKREEAEMALKSPDAVMGNRFIKLWWANRDNIPDGKQGNSGVAVPFGMMSIPSTSHPISLDKGKENPYHHGGKEGNAHGFIGQSPAIYHQKPLISGASKIPVLQKKNLENLELLKDEIRKKQQMLDQKRNEFKLQLDRLAKKAAGPKNGTVSDELKISFQGEMPADPPNVEISQSPVRGNEAVDKAFSTEHTMPPNYRAAPGQEQVVSPPLPVVSQGTPSTVKRFKLDNRPTAFRIVSPLPTGLMKIEALEEHFSTFGVLSTVELEEANDAQISTGISALISFTTRHFAEKAFLHGKSWKGHKLQFAWLTSSTKPIKDGIGSVNPSSSSEPTSCTSTTPKPNGEEAPSIKVREPEPLKTESSAEEEKDSKSSSPPPSPSGGAESGNVGVQPQI